jgi:hypothetical protein
MVYSSLSIRVQWFWVLGSEVLGSMLAKLIEFIGLMLKIGKRIKVNGIIGSNCGFFLTFPPSELLTFCPLTFVFCPLGSGFWVPFFALRATQGKQGSGFHVG